MGMLKSTIVHVFDSSDAPFHNRLLQLAARWHDVEPCELASPACLAHSTPHRQVSDCPRLNTANLLGAADVQLAGGKARLSVASSGALHTKAVVLGP